MCVLFCCCSCCNCRIAIVNWIEFGCKWSSGVNFFFFCKFIFQLFGLVHWYAYLLSIYYEQTSRFGPIHIFGCCLYTVSCLAMEIISGKNQQEFREFELKFGFGFVSKHFNIEGMWKHLWPLMLKESRRTFLTVSYPSTPFSGIHLWTLPYWWCWYSSAFLQNRTYSASTSPNFCL